MSRTTQFVFLAIEAIAVILFCVLLPFSVHAFPNRAPEIQVIDIETKVVEDSWLAFDKDYQGGVEVLYGDLGGDGVNEYIVAQTGGEDAQGLVRTFRSDHSMIQEFPVFSEDVQGAEVDIAMGDVDGDGIDEIVASMPYAQSSIVHIFDGTGKFDTGTRGAFEAFPKETNTTNRFGVSVAVGNVIGDSKMEIIVVTGAGSAPQVRIFDEKGVQLGKTIIPFAEDVHSGLTIATINTGGGEHDDLLVGLMNGAETWVKNYRIAQGESEEVVLAEFQAWTREYKSGVQIDGLDVDHDGTQEIAVFPAGDQRGEMLLFRGDGTPLFEVESSYVVKKTKDPLYIFEEDFRGGVHGTVANVDSDKSAELIVSPRRQRQHGEMERGEKYIEVNLTEQVEYVWEGGFLRNVYLISSGLNGTPSPEGDWEVLKKIESHTYDGRPYYFFGNTKWNLRYKQGETGRNFYLHTAYWHNNFGTQQSHGCINMREQDAEFIYHWSDIGTPVWLHK